jgi:hypothetical protein
MNINAWARSKGILMGKKNKKNPTTTVDQIVYLRFYL